MSQPKKPPSKKRSAKTQRRQNRQERSGTGARAHRGLPPKDLLERISEAASYDHPLPLLELGSSILTALDPRGINPLMRGEHDGPDRTGFINTLLATPLPETLTLLSVIHALSADELERARISRTLRTETTEAEGLLGEFAGLLPYRAVEMSHVLGDGDDVLLGVRTPDGDEFTLLIYIDYNMGTVVKDAYAIAEPLEDVVEGIKERVTDPDTRWADITLADARARIEEAIETGAITIPPLESEQWPAIRPLTEAVLRRAPAGGTGHQRPEWSEPQLRELADRFFASAYARGLPDDDLNRGLLENILWFGTDYGPGDPMRWSATAVEIILVDWVPRKIVAPAAELRPLPAVLRAFVRYCHAERGIRNELTGETLASIGTYEPEYQRLIRSRRRQGPDALLEAIGALGPLGDDTEEYEEQGGFGDYGDFDGDDDGDDDGEFEDRVLAGFQEALLEVITRAVGGDEQLDNLDDAPLPDEGFDWTGIPEDIHGRVSEVLQLCDRGTTELLDVEHRTAARRFLARVAAGNPAVFRRGARTEMSAAAVCWIIAKANDSFGLYGRGIYVKDLMAIFGVSSASQRARTFLAAAGMDDDNPDMELGTPDLLVSRLRSQLINMRDSCRAALGE
ncbi:MAG: DUF6398 domain-containing protein [Actinomycetota bacterium]|nr:DUF6398 domain-containing protein [Actinomycetota bacterium]